MDSKFQNCVMGIDTSGSYNRTQDPKLSHLLMDQLRRSGYNCLVKRSRDGQWGTLVNGTWNGLIGDLVDGYIDFTLPNMNPTADRFTAGTFLQCICCESKFGFLVNRKAESTSRLMMWWKVLPAGIWIPAVVIFLMSIIEHPLPALIRTKVGLISSAGFFLEVNAILSVTILAWRIRQPRVPFKTVVGAANAVSEDRYWVTNTPSDFTAAENVMLKNQFKGQFFNLNMNFQPCTSMLKCAENIALHHHFLLYSNARKFYQLASRFHSKIMFVEDRELYFLAEGIYVRRQIQPSLLEQLERILSQMCEAGIQQKLSLAPKDAWWLKPYKKTIVQHSPWSLHDIKYVIAILVGHASGIATLIYEIWMRKQ